MESVKDRIGNNFHVARCLLQTMNSLSDGLWSELNDKILNRLMTSFGLTVLDRLRTNFGPIDKDQLWSN